MQIANYIADKFPKQQKWKEYPHKHGGARDLRKFLINKKLEHVGEIWTYQVNMHVLQHSFENQLYYQLLVSTCS